MAHAASNGSRPAPTILTAPELMALALPEPRWAVPGLVPEGLSILAGKPKLGKSWLALGIAVAVASGGRAFGCIAVEPGEALYLALEDSPKRIQQRLASVLDGTGPPDLLHIAREWPKGEAGIEAIDEWLESHRRARYVCIDTHARFRVPAKGKERSWDDDYRDGEQLQRLAVKHRVAIVPVHHTRKMPAADWVDEISGTLGLAASADALLGLFRSRGNAEAELKVVGRDVEERELGLRFDPHAGTWSLLGAAATTVGLTPERRQMLEVLSGLSGPANASRLAEVVGKSPQAALKLLQRMRDEGLVVNTSAGWSLARAHARGEGVSDLSGTDRTPRTARTRHTHETDRTAPYKEEADLSNLVSLSEHLADTDDPAYVEALHDEEGIEA